MKRIFIILLCVSVCVSLLAFPVSAAELIALNYEDYVESTTVTSDGKIFNVSLPLDKASWGLYNENWQTINIASNPVVWQIYEDDVYNITCNFLGINGYYLDCSNIPDGTSVTFRWSYENMYNKIAYTVVTHTTFIVYYVDSNNNIISKSEIESEVDWDSNIDEVNSTEFATGSISVPLSVPDGAVGCRFQFRFHYAPFVKEEYIGTNPYMNVAFSLDSFDLNIPVDNYYLMVQQTGKQTELLKEIEEQLDDQGQTLDDILDQQIDTNDKLDDLNDKQEQTNGKLDDLNDKQDQTNDYLDEIVNGEGDPIKPDSSDIEDMGALEEDIKEEISGGIDEFGSVVDSAETNLLSYANTFLAVANVFNLFADISIIKTLLSISLALGFISVILNLGFGYASFRHGQAVSEARREEMRNQRR